jgi:hypothetical protein
VVREPNLVGPEVSEIKSGEASQTEMSGPRGSVSSGSDRTGNPESGYNNERVRDIKRGPESLIPPPMNIDIF